ncbi:MAG: PTS sugar transporter subunit IIA [Deltaproteobacteria bacterium]|jgi:PTS system nitrogen regulatory IIA component|nr:PTS sugar transporter subunit IIA [Deltaproteobacteria bacterium]MBW2537479.1 PTS sugar transporter subunit IIA [Deltaproteobacteria bacterium]
MRVADVLSADRVSIATDTRDGPLDKPALLRRLAALLADGAEGLAVDRVHGVLAEREQLASTGIGGGVAVPHAAVDGLTRQVGALLLCPRPVEFDSIDGEPVAIVFGLIGPRGAPTDHLRVLASVSRLLHSEEFRDQLVRSRDGSAAYELLVCAERRGA